jgi:homocysteine S-methyltransferase
MTRTTADLLARGCFLANGGTETYLLFQQGFALRDGCGFEVFDDPAALATLERAYLEPIADAALDHGHGLIFDALVWRASADWLARLGYAPAELERFNSLAIARTRAALERWRARRGTRAASLPILISADIGPRGDGYRIDARATVASALAYHARQLDAIADAGADLIGAMTMTHVEEAIGIALGAQTRGLPLTIAATVETDGRLPDGSTLAELIARVDDATDGYPLFYLVNCAHPTHVAPTLLAARDRGEPWTKRVRGFRANASAKSHAELDNSTTLDRGSPEELAAGVAELHRALDLRIVGGCCGTDAEHIRAIAGATAAPGLRAAG